MFDTRRRRASALARASTAVGSIDGDDVRRPARRLDRQVALAAAEVGDLDRRQQQSERARPGRPAAAGHQLARVAGVGARVGVEVLLAQPQHFLQPRFIGAHRRIGGRRLELRLQHRGQAARAGPWCAAAR